MKFHINYTQHRNIKFIFMVVIIIDDKPIAVVTVVISSQTSSGKRWCPPSTQCVIGTHSSFAMKVVGTKPCQQPLPGNR